MKSRNVKGSNIPSINLSKEIIAVLSRLDADEVKEIIVGIRDYVYKDKEPNVNEEIADIMDMTLDNINHIAKGYLNGKKGGRPKKSVITEVENNEFQIEQNTADLSPSNQLEVSIPQQAEQKPTEVIKTSIEEEFIADEDRYGKIVMDFVDKYYPTLKKVVEIKANYILFPTDENALDTKSADTKLKGLIDGYDFTEEEKSNLVQYLNDWRNEIVKNQYKTTAA